MSDRSAGPGAWPGVSLHIVTGKGGNGKTTVAAALALALAAGGRRTLLVELEGRQGIAQLFDSPPLPHAATHVAVARGGGDVDAFSVDAEAALVEYLEAVYRLGRARWVLDKVGAIDFATTIAPGLRDVFLMGTVYEAVGPPGSDRNRYDAVVLDAPPTGRVVRFLNVNDEVAQLARVGPVRRRADSIMELLRSSRTVVHFVTLLEEMPTQEVVDGVAGLRQVGLPIGGVMVNMVRQPLLRADEIAAAERRELPRADIAAGLSAAGLPSSAGIVRALVDEASDTAARTALGAAERAALRELQRPTYDVPRLAGGVDRGGLHELAAALTAQGFR